MSDPVTSPDHYNQGKIECIDAIWEAGFGEAYCIGNALKYLWRAGRKGEKVEDLAKASFYVRYLLFKLDANFPDPRVAHRAPEDAHLVPEVEAMSEALGAGQVKVRRVRMKLGGLHDGTPVDLRDKMDSLGVPRKALFFTFSGWVVSYSDARDTEEQVRSRADEIRAYAVAHCCKDPDQVPPPQIAPVEVV